MANSRWVFNLRDMHALSNQVNRDTQENQVLALSDSMAGLARYLNSVSGRKDVVFFSEGFDSSIILGTGDAKRLQEIAYDSSFGDLYRVDSDERYGSSSARAGVFEMLEEFRRCDCAIQAVDIGGLRAGADVRPQVDGQDGLFVLANQTGGELFRNYNDLGAAMADMLERSSLSYILSWQPEELGQPGEFHPIRVRLKKGVQKAQLRHRVGYYTPRPYSALDPLERRLQSAELLLNGEEGGEIPATVLAVPFRGSAIHESYVLTLIEIDGRGLTAGAGADRVAAEVYAYALDATGSIRDFLSQSIDLDVAKVGDLLTSRGFKLLGHLDLPPGEFDLRVLVRNTQTGATGLTRTTVQVPSFEGRQASLLPPLFIEPENTWVVGRERREGAVPVSYPLSVGGAELIPAARPSIPSRGESPMLLVGHHLGYGDLKAEGRLVALDGSGESPAEVRIQRRSGGGLTGMERMIAVLRPGEVASGEYRFELTLSDATGAEWTSAIPLTVY